MVDMLSDRNTASPFLPVLLLPLNMKREKTILFNVKRNNFRVMSNMKRNLLLYVISDYVNVVIFALRKFTNWIIMFLQT